jgi:2-oxoglutarate dehydrogenase E1 component
MLRRQARRPWRKPLIVFTPKSMLRHPEASSSLDEFTQPHFLPVVPDREITNARRILIASGKVGHELKIERRKRKDTSSAILFLDQLYPLPRHEIAAAFDAHPNAREAIWVQEERVTWTVFLCHAPLDATGAGSRPQPSLRETLLQRQPGHRLRQSP